MTCFTRVVIVLSFVRSALQLQGTPANQIIIGLSLFITFFVMAPTDRFFSTDLGQRVSPSILTLTYTMNLNPLTQLAAALLLPGTASQTSGSARARRTKKQTTAIAARFTGT